jgi:hypothetical protein
MSDVESTSRTHSYLPESGNTVLRVRTRELGLLPVVSISEEQYMSRLVTIRVGLAIRAGVIPSGDASCLNQKYLTFLFSFTPRSEMSSSSGMDQSEAPDY